MKLLYFNLCVFAIVFSTIAQEKIVFQKTIKTDAISKLALDVENIPLDIAPSEDENIHIVFKIKFQNYTKKQIDSVVNSVHVKKIKEGNLLKLELNSPIQIRRFSQLGGMRYFDYFFKHIDSMTKKINTYKKNKENKKIKEELWEEAKESPIGSLFSDRNEATSKDKKSKYQRVNFVLRLPNKLIEGLKLDMTANIKFRFDELKNVNIYKNMGTLRLKKLTNSKLTCVNGSAIIKEVNNSHLKLNTNISNVFMKIKNSTLSLNNATVQIGEIGENVIINDKYSSKVFLYNFSSNFKKFELTGDSSTIYFFEPKKIDYQLECFGDNSVISINGLKSVVGSKENNSDKKQIIKLLSRQPKKDKPFGGSMKFNIVNARFILL